jgi:hypothetical protein
MLNELEAIFSNGVPSVTFLYGSAVCLFIGALAAIWMRRSNSKTVVHGARHRQSAYSA